MSQRVLETVLTGRNLLSPMLAAAGRDVVAFNSTIARANAEAGVGAQAAARAETAAANTRATASAKAAAAATSGAAAQNRASTEIVAANTRAGASASASANVQARAHAKAAESAALSARAQTSANRALTAANGLLGTSLTPVTAGLGAVALGLGYAAFKGMEFGSSMSQVQAATQASAATMGQLREAALQAGADTQYSATEAAEGITELGKAGVSTKDILGGGLTGALNLAAAGQMDVAEAAQVGATALNVFNLSGSQMSHVADLLAAGAGKAQGSVHDMAAALNQSALVAKNTGLSIEDTTGALALFASNGLLGSDAGTSFKTMLMSLNPRSEEAARLMDELGLRAYDAQGNFVGLDTYAQQLQDSLSGMSQEQRNAALQTIFGTDAVRAATILYEAGAQGVDQWTAKVNDSGFAARQAAQLTDNLAGDLERLGGSVETFFTALGEGQQGALRTVVQTLTGLVNVGGDVLGFFTSLPRPVQIAVLAFAGFTALGDRVPRFFDAIWSKAASAATSLKNATTNAGGLKGALSGLAGMFNPATLGLTAATVVLAEFLQDMSEVDARMEAAADAGRALGQAFAEQAGEINGYTLEATRAALETAGLTDAMDDLGLTVDDVARVMQTGRGFDETVAKLQQMGLQTSMTSHSWSEWSNLLGGPAQLAMDAASGKLGELSDGFTRMYGAMVQERAVAGVRDVFAGIGEAARGGATVVGDLATNTDAFADAASAASEEADSLARALAGLNGGQLDVNAASRAYQESLRDAAELIQKARDGVEGYNLSLDNATAAGSRNTAALDDIASSAFDVSLALFKTNGDYDQFRGTLAQSRTDLFNTSMAFYQNEDAAWAYVNSVLAIPSEAYMNFLATGVADAQAEISTFAATLAGLPPGKEINVGVLSGPAIAALQEIEGVKVRVTQDGAVHVTAVTEEARQKLAELAGQAENLDAQRPTPVADLSIGPFEGKYGAAVRHANDLDSQRPTPVADMNTTPLTGKNGAALSQIWNLDAQRPTPQANMIDNASGTASRIIGLIAGIVSKTVTVTTVQRTIYEAGPRPLATGGPIRRAAGGTVYAANGRVVGPGTGTSDSVPAIGPGGTPYRLSAGEWIINAFVSQAEGDAKMALLNAGLGTIVPTSAGYAPAAMPGYGATVGSSGGMSASYDYSRSYGGIHVTTADQHRIAKEVLELIQENDWLTSPR